MKLGVFVGSEGRVESTGLGSVTRKKLSSVAFRAPGHYDESQTQAPLIGPKLYRESGNRLETESVNARNPCSDCLLIDGESVCYSFYFRESIFFETRNQGRV